MRHLALLRHIERRSNLANVTAQARLGADCVKTGALAPKTPLARGPLEAGLWWRSIRDTRLSGIIPVPLGRENWVNSLADRGTQPAHRYERCPGRQTFFAGVLTSPGQLCPLIAPSMLRALWGKLSQKTEVAHFVEHATPKAILIWEEAMPTLVGFGTFAALPEEQISEKISRPRSLW